LEKTFADNEVKLAELEGLLNERLGIYGELFGIVRQVAGETKAQIDDSVISGELKNRAAPLSALAKTKGLPEMAQLEYLWFALQQEMTAQGEVKRFTGEVVNLDGSLRETEILRIGPFTALADGQFIRYAGAHRYADLGRQPPSRFGDAADAAWDGAAGGLVAAPIDPSRGAILNLFLQMPTLFERISQGGVVGYLIMLLGLFGVALALERITRLTLMARRVRAQMSAGTAEGDTPLARVWAVYQANPKTDIETLELKLDDAILKEMPALEKHLALLKLLSGVAPLMGLLGTVTGMILTFQAITLFGTGDPKLMAGGISQALVTTVLGLVVAIPILLLHAIAATRSREIVQILEEQAAGLIAAHAEAK
jgi:biopolymer transport protein ExbB